MYLFKLLLVNLLIIFSIKPGMTQDQPPVQRDLMIINELLPGTYDNTEQVYFDKRLNIEKEMRHQNLHTEIRKVSIKNIKNAFFILNYFTEQQATPKILTLDIDNETNQIRMRTYEFNSSDKEIYKDAINNPKLLNNINIKKLKTDTNCDLYWKQIIHGYHATPKNHMCHIMINNKKYHEHSEMMLDDRSLWVANHIKDLDHSKRKKVYMSPYKLLRARWFSCVMDFSDELPNQKKSYSIKLHDQGGAFSLHALQRVCQIEKLE